MPDSHIVAEKSILLFYQLKDGTKKFHLAILNAWKFAPFEAGLLGGFHKSCASGSKFVLESKQFFEVAMLATHGAD
jgi:hypothetical protein